MGKLIMLMVVALPLFSWDMLDKLEEMKQSEIRAQDREEERVIDRQLEKKRVERRAVDKKLEQQRVERRLDDRRRNG